MTTFYICRHGQTENNKNGRLSGQIDTPLTEEGMQNAFSSAAKLSGITFDLIVSSDLGRAFITAYLIARKLGYSDEIKRFQELREVSYGSLSNILVSEVFARHIDLDKDDHEGESLAQMQTRVVACFNEIAAANQGKTILLVSHIGTINALYASFTGQDIVAVDSARGNAHDFVGKITAEDGKIVSFDEITA
jgi:probable phosphoglycerate mutase